eukprot:SM000060S19670  [mRNA]  locus=s60:473542:478726:- [translate_table: standard]
MAAAAATAAAAAVAEPPEVLEARELVAELCRHFYTLGWVSGTGGSISVRAGAPASPLVQRAIVMAPSGVQKERMVAEDMYVLAPEGSVLSAPAARPPPHRPPKCSECGPIFLKIYEIREAGAIIHSHGMESCLVTTVEPGATEFTITHMEMIKGIAGHGYHDTLVVPIVENTAREYELTDSVAAAMAKYPKSTAVLVRNHGLYVWGDSWIQAKTQAECYHYLFEAALRLHQLGLDPADPKHGPLAKDRDMMLPNGKVDFKKRPRASEVSDSGHPQTQSIVLLDIEGTTTPISFVTNVLFPFAKKNVRNHLLRTFETVETAADIQLLREQVDADLEAGLPGAVPIPPSGSEKDLIVAALEANVIAMINGDRKITALKQLQGHIWREGFANGQIKGEFFPDVASMLATWTAMGIRVYIYSSGSREAQAQIFGHAQVGDLRKYISGYFDTTTGQYVALQLISAKFALLGNSNCMGKREARSYKEIALSVGAGEEPARVCFCTDVLAEATAAKEAGLIAHLLASPQFLCLLDEGLRAVILSRPGNAPLPSDHGFEVLTSLADLQL